MQKSKIGEGSVESGAVSVNERRTSSTVLLDPTVVEQNPELQPMVLRLQAKAQKLLNTGTMQYEMLAFQEAQHFCIQYFKFGIAWRSVLSLSLSDTKRLLQCWSWTMAEMHKSSVLYSLC